MSKRNKNSKKHEVKSEVGNVYTVSGRYVMENGSQIASITRTPKTIDGYTFKFFSERARGRFSEFCEPLSMLEVVATLGYKLVKNPRR